MFADASVDSQRTKDEVRRKGSLRGVLVNLLSIERFGQSLRSYHCNEHQPVF